MSELVSVVIRTLNEEKYLEELLLSISMQCSERFVVEVIIVDSGSTDRTIDIARSFDCRITHITKEDFSFGRSLNVGCEFADGDYLVFISGHCVPVGKYWIHNLVIPLAKQQVAYTYGRQVGRDTTKFSENQLLEKYFPERCQVPQVGFFCNNANSALEKSTWRRMPFDEELTGLEDMYLAQQLLESGKKIGYVSIASVYHIHDETWLQVKNRYEREAIALQKIMPEVHFGILDFIRCFSAGVVKDFSAAMKKKSLMSEFGSIIMFRFAQYYGAFIGSHMHRKLSYEMKMKYFYPRITDMEVTNDRK